ncbi:MAG: ABC transporter substrate-binding protein [Desulfobacteraceae bacterium]|nr:ABC transporter substrate-binding protein [Desulfobacteraceae bacterium]
MKFEIKIQKSLKYSIMRIYFALALLCILSCHTDYAEKRGQHAAKAKGDIVIGVVYTSSYSNFFLEGVNLAVEEINQKGGLMGRKIKTIVRNDKDDTDRGKKIASELAENDDIIAVVGHSSKVAIPVSLIYENAGILFMSHGSSDPDLTRYNGNFTFRNIPTYEEFGYRMAECASKINFKKTVIFYERSDVHKSLAENFKKQATALGIEVIAARSYFRWKEDFKSIISKLKKEYEFDSVLISGSMPAAAVLVRQLREMGANIPIIGGNSLDTSDIFAIAGKAADNIIVPTVFNPGYPDRLIQGFVKRFETKYKFAPDTWAAQGYDAVSVLAHAIEKSGSAVPLVIGSTLRFLENWKGVTGSYSFTSQGDIVGKAFFFKAMREGEFVFLDEKYEYESDLFNYIEEYTLRIPLKNAVSTLDPGICRNESDIEIAEQLFLGLTDFDPKTFKPLPELAIGWRTSEDCKTYIFHLRTDAAWTNGTPVTAHDVLWAVRRNIHPDTKSHFAPRLYALKNAEAIHKGRIEDLSELGIYAPDDYSLVFRLEHPLASFPLLTSLNVYHPLPKDVIEKFKDQWASPENIQTNGSYTLASWDKGSGLFLKKNPRYYDKEKVSVPEIRYYVISKGSMGLAMYENNELDIMGSTYLKLPAPAISRIKNDPLLKNEYFEYPNLCTYTYAFNTEQPPFDNTLVRKAVSSAIDRLLLVAENQGSGLPAITCTPPTAFGHVPREKNMGTDFDPLKAREWLAQAGYPGGKGFPEILLLHSTSGFHEKIARSVQTQLDVSLNIKVKLMEAGKKNYKDIMHMFSVKMCGDYPDAESWLNFFHVSGSFFETGWKSREFSQLIDKAQKESDINRRKEFYERAEQVLCKEEAVVFPLYYDISNCLVKPRIKGLSHMFTGGQHIRNWYFEENN